MVGRETYSLTDFQCLNKLNKQTQQQSFILFYFVYSCWTLPPSSFKQCSGDLSCLFSYVKKIYIYIFLSLYYYSIGILNNTILSLNVFSNSVPFDRTEQSSQIITHTRQFRTTKSNFMMEKITQWSVSFTSKTLCLLSILGMMESLVQQKGCSHCWIVLPTYRHECWNIS